MRAFHDTGTALLIALLALGPACAQQPPGPDAGWQGPALAAVSEAIGSYEAGDAERLFERFDRDMIGYAQLAEGVRREFAALKNRRVQLIDTQVTSERGAAYVRSSWEKRVLRAKDLKPQLYRGHTTFILHERDGVWRIAGLAGDNIFSTPALSTP